MARRLLTGVEEGARPTGAAGRLYLFGSASGGGTQNIVAARMSNPYTLATGLNNTCQHFRFVATDGGYVRIVNQATGKVADVVDCGTADGADVRQWAWLGNDCQQWRLNPAQPQAAQGRGVLRDQP